MNRKVYTPEFKHQAVELVIKENFTVKQVAMELDIHENSLYCWIQDVEIYGDKAFPGRGSHEYVEQKNQAARERKSVFTGET